MGVPSLGGNEGVCPASGVDKLLVLLVSVTLADAWPTEPSR